MNARHMPSVLASTAADPGKVIDFESTVTVHAGLLHSSQLPCLYQVSSAEGVELSNDDIADSVPLRDASAQLGSAPVTGNILSSCHAYAFPFIIITCSARARQVIRSGCVLIRLLCCLLCSTTRSILSRTQCWFTSLVLFCVCLPRRSECITVAPRFDSLHRLGAFLHHPQSPSLARRPITLPALTGGYSPLLAHSAS